MIIILIVAIALALSILGIAYIRYRIKNRKSSSEKKEEILDGLESNLKEHLADSATDLVKKFQWYFTYDPEGDPEQQSTLNREKRRRVKRHYEKFLWDWFELPTRLRDIGLIVEYLTESTWNNHVVKRYVETAGDLYLGQRQLKKQLAALDKMKKEADEVHATKQVEA